MDIHNLKIRQNDDPKHSELARFFVEFEQDGMNKTMEFTLDKSDEGNAEERIKQALRSLGYRIVE